MPDPRGQRSASDPRNIKAARQLEARRTAREIDHMREVLGTFGGRAMFADLLRASGVYRSIWDNSARIHYNAGRQDWGHELMAKLIQANPELYDRMEMERRAQDTRDAAEEEALHTARPEDKENEQ